MKKLVFLLAFICMSSCLAQKTDAEDRRKPDELKPENIFPAPYVGTYAGNLNIADASGTIRNVPMEIEIAPTEKEGEYRYDLIYFVSSEKQVQSYILKTIDAATGQYAIDENNGIVLRANYIRQTLYSSFDINNNHIASSVEFRNDGRIMFKIVVSSKENPVKTGGKEKPVITYPTVNVQKGVLSKKD